MSFESAEDVLKTISTYSKQVVDVYEHFKLRSRDDEVKSFLDLAIDQELRLQGGLKEYGKDLPMKVSHAQFKWHDKRQLFKALEHIEDQRITNTDEAVQLVSHCEHALSAYCDGLTASTNSEEVLEFIETLKTMRNQEMREAAWQVQRSGE